MLPQYPPDATRLAGNTWPEELAGTQPWEGGGDTAYTALSTRSPTSIGHPHHPTP